MNLRVITAEDNAYFVRCPVDPEGEDNHPPELRASTATLATPASRELRVWHGPEAEQQLLRLGIERARDRAGVRMRMCVVFAPSAADAQGRVQALQISDEVRDGRRRRLANSPGVQKEKPKPGGRENRVATFAPQVI